jgi:hypothetical protein
LDKGNRILFEAVHVTLACQAMDSFRPVATEIGVPEHITSGSVGSVAVSPTQRAAHPELEPKNGIKGAHTLIAHDDLCGK